MNRNQTMLWKESSGAGSVLRRPRSPGLYPTTGLTPDYTPQQVLPRIIPHNRSYPITHSWKALLVWMSQRNTLQFIFCKGKRCMSHLVWLLQQAQDVIPMCTASVMSQAMCTASVMSQTSIRIFLHVGGFESEQNVLRINNLFMRIYTSLKNASYAIEYVIREALLQTQAFRPCLHQKPSWCVRMYPHSPLWSDDRDWCRRVLRRTWQSI